MVPVADCRLPQLATSLERQLRVEQTRQVELSGQLAAAAELQQRQLDELRHTRDTLEAEKLQAESALALLRETSKTQLTEKERVGTEHGTDRCLVCPARSTPSGYLAHLSVAYRSYDAVYSYDPLIPTHM